MAISRARLAAAAATALALCAAATAQQRRDTPESLLPPGFGDAPAPMPTSSAAPRIVSPTAGVAVPAASPTDALALPLPVPSPSPSASPTPVDPETLAAYEMPLFARRSLASVGTAGPADGGVRPDAFGRADGQYIETLMRRLAAPLPSRWLSIALRRALLSRIDTPLRTNGADFVAERAWLLLRMGEANAARAIVQNVDTANHTLKLYQVAMQVALATGDPAALCPLADAATLRDRTNGWVMAQAMCGALANRDGDGRALFAAARRKRVATGIDLQLAQKVLGAGSGRQAVTIEWDGVDRLNAWRFGLATATGVAIPDTLYATVGRQVTGWRALAPTIPLADRAAPAEAAAAMGVLSNLALIDLYGAIGEANDAPAPLAAVASDLTAAYVGADVATRLGALKQLWDGGGRAPDARYARYVLTARAAARIRPTDGAAEADRMIGAMLTAGLDRSVQRWRGQAPRGSDAWAMLTLADPDLRGAVPYADLTGYAGTGNTAAKQRLLFAGLAGLGRLDPGDVDRAAQTLNVAIGTQTPWTRAIERAVREGQPGTVLLLAATGMQTGAWEGVPPEALYHIVASLRAVGMGGYARMIAAEAIARG